MARLALLVEYNGKHFCGSQFQAGVRTVQGELEKALSILARSTITAVFSGRTDSGVHASGQVVHCDWPEDKPDLFAINWSLNGILPSDLSVARIEVVDSGFHARYKAIRRSYAYRILNRQQRSALLKDNSYFMPRALDLEEMQLACQLLVGRHDFVSFRSSNSDKVNTVCQISEAELLKLPEGLLEFRISANHFVYNMVRIIVGTLVEIGLGKRHRESLAQALAGKDRALAGPTAPALGLSLKRVQYPEEFKLFVVSPVADEIAPVNK